MEHLKDEYPTIGGTNHIHWDLVVNRTDRFCYLLISVEELKVQFVVEVLHQ
jgi:hypothetical protein